MGWIVRSMFVLLIYCLFIKGPHAFVPYVTSNSPPNPPDYVPTFYLVNKPPGEGKRDTGLLKKILGKNEGQMQCSLLQKPLYLLLQELLVWR